MEYLDCQAISLLEIISVTNKPVDIELLHVISGLQKGHITSIIEDLEERQFIIEKSYSGLHCYDFQHVTMKEILYQRIDPQRRKMLHETIGNIAESSGIGICKNYSTEDLVYHFVRSSNKEKAIKYGLDHAQKSKDIYLNFQATVLSFTLS